MVRQWSRGRKWVSVFFGLGNSSFSNIFSLEKIGVFCAMMDTVGVY